MHFFFILILKILAKLFLLLKFQIKNKIVNIFKGHNLSKAS